MSAQQPHSESTPAAAALFDREGALRRMGGNESLLQEMMQFFLEDTPQILQQINDSMSCGNVADAERFTHSIRGLIVNFGAAPVLAVATEVEKLCRAGDLETARRLSPEMARGVEALIDLVRTDLSVSR